MSAVFASYSGGTRVYLYQYADESQAGAAYQEMKDLVDADIKMLSGQKIAVAEGGTFVYIMWPSSNYLVVLQNQQPRGSKERDLMLRLASVYFTKHPSGIESYEQQTSQVQQALPQTYTLTDSRYELIAQRKILANQIISTVLT